MNAKFFLRTAVLSRRFIDFNITFGLLVFLFLSSLVGIARANNFYVGIAYAPSHYSHSHYSTADNPDFWFPVAIQTHLGYDLELFNFSDVDSEQGSASFGAGARLGFSATSFGDTADIQSNPLVLSFDTYFYGVPSSQLGLKLFSGVGFRTQDLSHGLGTINYGISLPIAESIDIFFEVKNSNTFAMIVDTSYETSSYNFGINWKF